MNALDRPLTVTTFADHGASVVRAKVIPLRSILRGLQDTTADAKGDLPWLKLARFGENRTANGSLRSNANVLEIEGIEADYDGGRITVDEAEQTLRRADLAGIIYTSPSNAADAPRWRVLCPTSKPLPPAGRAALVARLNGIFDGALAGESFTLSQAYYYGSVRKNPAHRVVAVEGRAIDDAAELDAAARWRASKKDKAPVKGAEADDRIAPIPQTSSLGVTADPLKVAAALDAMPNDGPADWEEWNRVGMAIWAATSGADAGRIAFHAWSRRNDAYDPKATEVRWLHYRTSPPTGIGAGTLFHMARANQTTAPEFAASPLASEPGGGMRFQTLAESDDEPPRSYVVKGLIAEGDLACLFGPPGAGKSVLAPHMAYAVARGAPVFGRRTRQGTAVYVAAEDPTGLRGRGRALRVTHGDAPDFFIADRVGSLLDDGPAGEPRAFVAERKPLLVIIDTLALAFPGIDENSSQDMGRIVAFCRSLTAHGAAVLIVHHDTKARDSTPRGHSLFNGALDVSIRLDPADDAGIIRGALVKNRNGGCDAALAFRIPASGVSVGTDEDGDPITAPIAFETNMPARSKPKLSRLQNAALAALRDIIAAAGSKGVSEDEWRKQCDDRRVSTSDSAKNRREAFNGAFAALRDAKLVIARGGQVWLPGVADEFPPTAEQAESAESGGIPLSPPRQSGGALAESAESPFRDSASAAAAAQLSKNEPHRKATSKRSTAPALDQLDQPPAGWTREDWFALGREAFN